MEEYRSGLSLVNENLLVNGLRHGKIALNKNEDTKKKSVRFYFGDLIRSQPPIVDHTNTLTTRKVKNVGIIACSDMTGKMSYCLLKHNNFKTFPIHEVDAQDCGNLYLSYKRLFFNTFLVNAPETKKCIAINDTLFFGLKLRKFVGYEDEWIEKQTVETNDLDRPSKLYFKDNLVGKFEMFSHSNYIVGGKRFSKWINDFIHSLFFDTVLYFDLWTDAVLFPPATLYLIVRIDGISGIMKLTAPVYMNNCFSSDFVYSQDFKLMLITQVKVSRSFIKDNSLDFNHLILCNRYFVNMNHIDIERVVPIECDYCDTVVEYKPFVNINYGKKQFILSGGESNPGPVCSKYDKFENRLKLLCYRNRIRTVARYPQWDYKRLGLHFENTLHYVILSDGSVSRSDIISFYIKNRKNNVLYAQGLFSNMANGFRTAKNYVQRQTDRFDNMTYDFSYITGQARRFVEMVTEKTSNAAINMNEIMENVNTKVFFKVVKYTNYIISLKQTPIMSVSFWMSVASFLHELWLDVLNMFNAPPTMVTQCEQLVEQAGPFEAYGIALIFKGLLPTKLFNLIKDLPAFTSSKLLDDSTYIQKAVDLLFTAPYKIVDMIAFSLNIPDYVVQFFKKISDMSPYSETIMLKNEMRDLLRHNKDHPHSICESAFADKTLDCYKRLSDWRENYLTQAGQVCKDMLNTMKSFEHLKNKILYMKDPVRVEPVWCVFEGPPGSGKTTLMNWLLKGFEASNTIYVHAATAEKDFYDMYDSEDIFAVDDIGQKGIFQWSNMINFVSTSKFPLECAQAELKNTKFFTSNLIMSTTNNVNLTITQNCGISDIQALWRRMHRFNFKDIVFQNGKWRGEVKLERYRIQLNVGHWITEEIYVFGSNNDEPILRMIAQYIKEAVACNYQFKHESEVSYVDLGALPRSHLIQEADPSEDVDDIYDEFFDAQITADDEEFVSFPSAYDVFANSFGTHEPSNQGPGISYSDATFDTDWWKHLPTFESINLYETYKEHGLGYALGRAIGCTTNYIMDWLRFPWFVECVVILIAYISAIVLLFKWDPLGQVIRSRVATSKNKSFRSYMSSRTTRQRVSQLRTQAEDLPHLIRYKHNMCDVAVSITIPSGNLTRTKVSKVMGLVSQRCILLPYHVLFGNVGKIYVTVGKYGQVNYDHQPVELVYSDEKQDLCILRLPRAVPVYYRKIKIMEDTFVKDLFLINSTGVYNLNDKVQKLHFSQQYYAVDSKDFKGTVTTDDISYDMSFSGLCGALVMTADGVPLGMHVAGCNEYGVAKIFTTRNVQMIKAEFDKDECIELPKVEIEEDSSRTVLARNEYNHINSETTIVPSVIHGVFPVERAPANLKVLGNNTVYEMDKKSHKKVQEVDEECLKFAIDYMKTIIPKGWKKLSEEEIINGNDYLNRIDKTTSCGYGFAGKKSDWIDYDNGKLKDKLKTRVTNLKQQFISDKYNFNSYHATTLKDELRNIEKVDKPRAFKTTPLDILILERELLGNLLTHIHKNKFINGIMVGINPFSSDWKRLRDNVTKFGNKVFDGDYGKWDGAMMSQFQHALNELIQERSGYTGDDLKVLEGLLMTLIYTPTITEHLVSITTHSLPSGRGVTADYNSMIGKMYDAYIFCYLYKMQYGKIPTVDYYILNVYNAVYGDDKLVGCSDEVAEWFNGPSYERIANMMGLDFTPADKGSWTYTNRNIEDCTFLKRGFVFHSKLGLVAPIEERSMTSTLNFVKDDVLNYELTCVKILNFQREAYLHEDKYDIWMNRVRMAMDDKNIDIPFLDEEYLCELYANDDYDSLLVLH